jgi:15-cis-phytoene synthase
MQDSYSYCAQLVREADWDRYLAALFAPEHQRRHLFALYAFNVEIARVRELVHEPGAGEIRLQWWREALDQRGRGEVRANPVADALLDTIELRGLSQQLLLALIEARAFDLYDDPMPSLTSFEGYARATSSVVIALASSLLGGDQVQLEGATDHAGIAYAIAGLLRAVPLHAARGQLYVPLDLLARHGARAEDILAGRPTSEVRAALAELRGIAHRHFTGLVGSPAARKSAVSSPAFLPVALVPAILARMESAAYDPFGIVELPRWRRQWILWRAASRDFPAG